MFIFLKITYQTCKLFMIGPNDGKVVDQCLKLGVKSSQTIIHR